MFKAKTIPLLHKTLLPLTLSSTSTSTSLLRMAFSTGPNAYFPSQPEPGDPFFSGLESLIQGFSTFSYGEYYAKNNPFQKSGPKGAVVKIALAKSEDLYMRVDMPGVPKDRMFYFGDPYNSVFFGGSASKEWEYDQERKHRGFFGRPYRCCQVTQLQANLINGVLRMRSSKEKMKNAIRCCYGPVVDTRWYIG